MKGILVFASWILKKTEAPFWKEVHTRNENICDTKWCTMFMTKEDAKEQLSSQ